MKELIQKFALALCVLLALPSVAADLRDVTIEGKNFDYFSLDGNLMRMKQSGVESSVSGVKSSGISYITDRFGVPNAAVQVTSGSTITFSNFSGFFTGTVRYNKGLTLNDKNYARLETRTGGVVEKQGQYYVRVYRYYLPYPAEASTVGGKIEEDATYVMWFLLDSAPAETVTILKRSLSTSTYGYSSYTATDYSAYTNKLFEIKITGNDTANPLRLTARSYIKEYTSSTTVAVGKWHCLVVSGKSKGNGFVYLDGSTICSFPPGLKLGYLPTTVDNRAWTDYRNYPDYSMEGSTENNPATLTIGNFKGAIDDVVFYHSSLSTAEVKSLYEAGCVKAPVVTAAQRYPWNGLVDINVKVEGPADAAFEPTFGAVDENGHTNLLMNTVTRRDGSEVVSLTPGNHQLVWNASADLDKGWMSSRVSVSVDIEPSATYRVRFNANGGVGTMKDEVFSRGVEKGLISNQFTRAGYTFDGWATSAGGSKAYVDGQKVKDLTTIPGGVFDLYARWKGVPYTVRFDANGGTGEMSDESFVYGTLKKLTPNAFKMAGKQFAGWSKSADGVKSYGDGVSVSELTTVAGEVVVLYAVWVDGTYMVVDLYGGGISYLEDVPSGGWDDTYKTTKLVLRKIPHGEFSLGSYYRVVILTYDFYIGVFELTQKQYEMILGRSFENPSRWKGDTYPVSDLSYSTIRGKNGWPSTSDVSEAQFMGKLRTLTGRQFDLPTESQWEYACRAGTTSDYNNGGSSESDLRQLGRYSGNFLDGAGPEAEVNTRTPIPVGCYAPNSWGLYDMHGNVMEWCLDWYQSTMSSGYNPVGPETGTGRVLRGGCYASGSATGCTSSYRTSHVPYESDDGYGTKGIYGFRVALQLE